MEKELSQADLMDQLPAELKDKIQKQMDEHVK